MLIRLGICACLAAGVVGCSPAPAAKQMVLLTSGSCVNTPKMRANLDAALTALGKPASYTVIDLDTLPASDIRRGYPTPTVLYGGTDVFDMPTPERPLAEPT